MILLLLLFLPSALAGEWTSSSADDCGYDELGIKAGRYEHCFVGEYCEEKGTDLNKWYECTNCGVDTYQDTYSPSQFDGIGACKACPLGETSAEGSSSCTTKACTCSGGTNATGTACPTHNTEKCVSCEEGYYPDGDSCEAFTCTCENGSPATGSACTSDGAKCGSCDSGHYLSGESCPAWTTCSGAQYASVSPSTTQNRVCATKVCTCSGGTHATGTDCPTHGAAKCVSCEEGYFPDGDSCALKTCTCSDGTGATGTDCPTHGAAKCGSCGEGYYLDGDSCVKSEFNCYCTNGTPVSPCTRNGEECGECNSPYEQKAWRYDCWALCDIDKCIAGDFNNGNPATLTELIRSKHEQCSEQGDPDPCDVCTFEELKTRFIADMCN